MAFVDASASRVLVNERHLSAYIDSWTYEGARDLATVTTILDTGARFIPSIHTGKVGVTGLFDSTTGAIHDEVSSALGVDNGLLWTILPSGLTLGQPALMCVSELSDYKVTSKVGEAVAVSIDTQSDDGTDIGVQLHALGAETVDTNSTSVDNAAGTTNGGVAHLHVTAYSGLTNAVIKVQHSTDNSAWSDLITLSTVTAITSQRSTVTGTVNRYVRSFLDVTGAGSVTFALSFARR
jgi:hypothetical protein